MKKAGLFPKIIYYIFTFLVGIILALTLPPYFFNFTELPRVMVESLDQGDFDKAMLLTGNYYNKELVYERKFDGAGGIMLFEAVMPLEQENKEANLPKYALYKTYLGYIYGIGDSYKTQSAESNRTEVLITGTGNESVSIPLLDYDEDGNESLDGVSTAAKYGFIHLDFAQYTVPSIDQITFKDADGKQFWQSESNLGLNFDSPFFREFDGYIDDYNNCIVRFNAAQDDGVRKSIDNEQSNLYTRFKASLLANDNYVIVDNENQDYLAARKTVSKPANVKASLIVVAYFVGIYIIADFLLGSHYIIKFFNWFLFKVCRIPRKSKKAPNKNEVFGHDYFSMVTLKLDLSDAPDFGGSAEIKYTNSDCEAKWTLLKADNYTATQRIKAGVYVNPFIDINRNFAPVDLPDNLEIEGYRVEKTIKIVRVANGSDVVEQQAQIQQNQVAPTESVDSADPNADAPANRQKDESDDGTNTQN